MVLNGMAPGVIAAAALQMGARLVQISTNEVFEGVQIRAYKEDDPATPINPYGMSKLAGEGAVRQMHPQAIVVRTAWIFNGPGSFPAKIIAAAKRMAGEGRPLRVVADEVGNPTPAATLADRIVTLALRPDAPPIIHLAGEPPISRWEWAARLIDVEGLPEPVAISALEYRRDSTPPLHAVLDTSLAQSMGLEINWVAN